MTGFTLSVAFSQPREDLPFEKKGGVLVILYNAESPPLEYLSEGRTFVGGETIAGGVTSVGKWGRLLEMKHWLEVGQLCYDLSNLIDLYLSCWFLFLELWSGKKQQRQALPGHDKLLLHLLACRLCLIRPGP